jgi:ribosome-associated protein
MLIINPKLCIPLTEFEFSFARSPGPGGQNVNKVNSKAILKWDFEKSTVLSEPVRQRFQAKYGTRISKEGQFQITSHRYRDQGRNVADCLSKLRELILTVLPEPVKRKAPKVSKAAKRRRLDSKRLLSEKKQGRAGRFGE